MQEALFTDDDDDDDNDRQRRTKVSCPWWFRNVEVFVLCSYSSNVPLYQHFLRFCEEASDRSNPAPHAVGEAVMVVLALGQPAEVKVLILRRHRQCKCNSGKGRVCAGHASVTGS